MKRILVLFLILTGGIFAQGVVDLRNSTTTTLDSAATFTGINSACYSYASITVNVFSDSSGTLIVQFAKDNSTYDKEVIWHYTGGDTTTNFTTPILAPYYRVLFTNSADSQLVFRLYTYLNREWIPATGTGGKIEVTDSEVISQGTTLDSLRLLLNSNLAQNNEMIGNQTDGDQVVKPYLPYIQYKDSSFQTTKDTASYNFQHNYLVVYLGYYNPNASADTIAIEMFSAIKNGWTPNGIGIKNLSTGDDVSNAAEVVIPAATMYKYEVKEFRPGNLRIRTLSTKVRAINCHVGFIGVN